MILETFFLAEDKRAMHTRIFQDLLRHEAFGRNIHVCAAQSSVKVRGSGVLLEYQPWKVRAGEAFPWRGGAFTEVSPHQGERIPEMSVMR
jgi:hypothetical protein